MGDGRSPGLAVEAGDEQVGRVMANDDEREWVSAAVYDHLLRDGRVVEDPSVEEVV